MRDLLVKKLQRFLKLQLGNGEQGCLIVACSGGPDSKALLYLLMQCQSFFGLNIQVAHIDHGWRKESRAQADALAAEVDRLGIKFHLHASFGVDSKESVAREVRYDFLCALSQELKAQAVLLGHQMEDQAETVLKRVLEGASLPFCGGMKMVARRGEATFWRPFLETSKKDLLTWLKRHRCSYDIDETNLSPAYLRGRMRSLIFPGLEAAFGKNITKNLCQLGRRAQRLENYLVKQTEPLWSLVQGYCISTEHLRGLDEVVLDYFFRVWAKRERIGLSCDQVALLVRNVQTMKTVSLQKHNLLV